MEARLLGVAALLALSGASALGLSPAGAITVTYDYVGSPYEVGAVTPGGYSFGAMMTGSVTFNFDTTAATGTYILSGGDIAALSLTSGDFSVDITAFYPYPGSPAPSGFIFQSGVIVGWNLDASLPNPPLPPFFNQYSSRSSEINSTFAYSPLPYSIDYIVLEGGFAGSAQTNTSGVWTLQPSAVPLPPTIVLLSTGLAVMGLLGWRRKRGTRLALSD